tara:strand:+ start:981 stop:1430 length:450 start_codon:yes stop_codon:yes gene_type:complete
MVYFTVYCEIKKKKAYCLLQIGRGAYLFFLCPLVSSWLNTDAASDFISFLVGVFLPDKTLDAKVEVLLDDCFLAIFYLHAKRGFKRQGHRAIHAPDIDLCVYEKTERFFAVSRREQTLTVFKGNVRSANLHFPLRRGFGGRRRFGQIRI